MAPDELVYQLLQDITLRPRAAIKPEDRLIEDLSITGDDLSMWFARELQRQLRDRPTAEEWRNVHTVQDAVELAVLHWQP